MLGRDTRLGPWVRVGWPTGSDAHVMQLVRAPAPEPLPRSKPPAGMGQACFACAMCPRFALQPTMSIQPHSPHSNSLSVALPFCFILVPLKDAFEDAFAQGLGAGLGLGNFN